MIPAIFAFLGLEGVPLIGAMVRTILIITLGFPLLLLFARLGSSIIMRHFSEHLALIFRKFVTYFGSLLLIITVLLDFDFNLSAILGTAGIASIAFGFAAQTSLSNFISGIFLLGEKPFEVGDIVLIDGTLGYVLSIDLMSVKVRTFDNLCMRIPNQTLIQTTFTNVTRFPIRRLDVIVHVPFKEDIRRVFQILREVADANVYTLDEPEPLVLFQEYGDSFLKILLGVWFEKSNFVAIKNTIMMDVKERFDREGIEFPVPHLAVYAGDSTKPFPVQWEQVEKLQSGIGNRPMPAAKVQ